MGRRTIKRCTIRRCNSSCSDTKDAIAMEKYDCWHIETLYKLHPCSTIRCSTQRHNTRRCCIMLQREVQHKEVHHKEVQHKLQ